MTNNILSVLQLCDTSLPTGAFSHSFGLESYIQDGAVHDAKTFCDWLDIYLNEQLVYSDGLACQLVYEALENDETLEKIWAMDRFLTVQNLPRETRDGVQRMGIRMLEIIGSIYDVQMISKYLGRIQEKKSFGHSAIAFTMIAHHLHLSKSETILYYLYSAMTSLIQNAIRAIPLGQTTGQKIIHEYKQKITQATEKIKQLDEDDLGIVSPGLEISQMNHERVKIRIFMS